MTALGNYLVRKSINKSEIARKTGISKARLSELTIRETTHLRAKELYLIALAIDADPCDMLRTIYGDLRLIMWLKN